METERESITTEEYLELMNDGLKDTIIVEKKKLGRPTKYTPEERKQRQIERMKIYIKKRYHEDEEFKQKALLSMKKYHETHQEQKKEKEKKYYEAHKVEQKIKRKQEKENARKYLELQIKEII
jgi:hypothetical protein